MTIAFLDINDCNLQLWHERGRIQSPGYALLEGREYRFGGAARGAARLRPRDINTRFWWQLSTEALQPALGPARHTADLVHAHLLALHREAGEPSEILLATSGSMQREQLSLLLGIVQQCPFDAVGLVNRSTLLGSLHGNGGRGNGRRVFHLELQLHQALLSELATSGSDISLSRAVPLPGCGLLQLQERLVEVVAAGFIRQTRFDPRRKADTEQLLYDALPQALQALAGGNETNIEVNGYRARVTRDELAGVGQRLYDSAAQTMGALEMQDQLLVDPLIGLLPGLGDQFPQAQVAAAEAQWQAAQGHGDALLNRGQALGFTTTLPCLARGDDARDDDAPIEPAPLEPMPPAVIQPSHLLQGHRARPLNTAGTTLENGAEIAKISGNWQLRGSGVAVNGEAASEGQVLAAGDLLTAAGGAEYRLIEVTAEDS
jgi:hypothetical protein